MTENLDNRPVKIGVIGVGGRAVGLIGTMAEMGFVEIAALSDVRPEKMEEGLKVIREHADYPVSCYTDYRELLEREDIEGVVIATSWNDHTKIAIAAMKAGKYTGFEVGGTSSIQQCWDLVHAYEETGTPCMILENCCYGQYELAVLNMIRKGLFGEIIHVEGSYQHDLRGLAEKIHEGYQRSLHHMKRNADLYPTHEIGPLAKYLNINRGNRFLTLTSTASRSRGLDLRAAKSYGENSPIWHRHALGDVVTTVIKCAGGETVTIVHDTSLPRPYTRNNAVHGTKGIWMEINHSMYFEPESFTTEEEANEIVEHKWENADPYLEKYRHPIWDRFLNDGVTGGHGGMDYLVLRAFIYSIQHHIPLPIDVYDSATWMSITCLTEESIAKGSMPVYVPDFTNGAWVCREPMPESPWSLDA
ncbi:MAG: Gfo/Idh/MocA family oxidoreductase [Lachnospiraceae bacterium]|nr:Gfo/Idh/MocA family oxidoreductase [Lachnospiraceae bacterium]